MATETPFTWVAAQLSAVRAVEDPAAWWRRRRRVAMLPVCLLTSDAPARPTPPPDRR